MSATIQDKNPFKQNNKVSILDEDCFLNKEKGIVKNTFGPSVEVLLNNNITVIINYTKLRKLKNGSKKSNRTG